MRSWTQAAETTFLCRVSGLTNGDRVRSLVTQEELRVELLLFHVERESTEVAPVSV